MRWKPIRNYGDYWVWRLDYFSVLKVIHWTEKPHQSNCRRIFFFLNFKAMTWIFSLLFIMQEERISYTSFAVMPVSRNSLLRVALGGSHWEVGGGENMNMSCCRMLFSRMQFSMLQKLPISVSASWKRSSIESILF